MSQAIVVPHTHWDREWYAPFETMRFHLVRFLDELVETLEREPELPVFLLDGQAVIVEDYLQIRRGMRDRVEALVRAGRLVPGPFYVQPDEFHVSGEAIVRNLLHGIAASRELGYVMREGYLPDTFGHVAQLPQILAGFGIDTFYAMRGFGLDADGTGSELWWEAPDGSRALAEWLTESYSNAAVLTPDPATTALHHGTLVRYDDLRELLDRLGPRSPSGVLLLLNGGDHLRVQDDLPATVAKLDGQVGPELRLGGLEEFHALRAAADVERPVIRGELRRGARHDVFEGIASTRTPMKAAAERVAALLDVAERLDAIAHRVDGTTSLDSLRHAWREHLKNHAHDSACGCCVDEVHAEMATRFTTIGQLATAVRDDALERIAHNVAGDRGGIPLVVVNPSGHPRSGRVAVDVCPDLDAPLGERRFGWTQGPGVDWAGWSVRDAAGEPVPFTVERGVGYAVADPLDRRKELGRDRFTVAVADLPALSATTLHLVPEPAPVTPPVADPVLDAGFAPDGTVWITDRATGRRWAGLLELLDDADAGDTYGHGPLGDAPLTSRDATWLVGADGRSAATTLTVPRGAAGGDDAGRRRGPGGGRAHRRQHRP